MHTEADAWVIFTDTVTLLVGEEHVGRETTLRGVGVCEGQPSSPAVIVGMRTLLLLLDTSRLGLGGTLCGFRHGDGSRRFLGSFGSGGLCGSSLVSSCSSHCREDGAELNEEFEVE